jgi:hypothetical protein
VKEFEKPAKRMLRAGEGNLWVLVVGIDLRMRQSQLSFFWDIGALISNYRRTQREILAAV